MDFPDGFDPQPVLTGGGLRLRPLKPDDRAPLYQAASDPLIWEQHPANTRHERHVFDPYFDMLLEMGGTLVVEDIALRELIGCSAYYTRTPAIKRLRVGYTFLTRAYWGGQTNLHMKRLMLEHVFKDFDEAWFDIGAENMRSRKATQKLGAVLTHHDIQEHMGPQVDYVCYCLTREAWQASWTKATDTNS